jgi:hypothetical protein
VLQEQDAGAGDCIVRARGAWFGNRSISAEVDLPVGVYEVLPKIEARRNADAPEVHEVVTKVAERNPQKLRQIGLNYDIANAKGLSELTDEEKKEKEQKKKEAAAKKKKKLEEEAKEKLDFEAWKREEKAEYEAWKKEKSSREAKEAPKDSANEKVRKEAEVTQDEVSAPVEPAKSETGPASPSTIADEKPKDKGVASGAETKTPKDDKATTPKGNDNAKLSNDQGPPEDRHPSAPSSIADGPGPSPPIHGRYLESAYARQPESVYGNIPPPPPPQADRPVPDSAPKPWNAVCVLGLRVYSQDPEVSIKLVKPKNAEEGGILDVDGDTAAGATM